MFGKLLSRTIIYDHRLSLVCVCVLFVSPGFLLFSTFYRLKRVKDECLSRLLCANRWTPLVSDNVIIFSTSSFTIVTMHSYNKRLQNELAQQNAFPPLPNTCKTVLIVSFLECTAKQRLLTKTTVSFRNGWKNDD